MPQPVPTSLDTAEKAAYAAFALAASLIVALPMQHESEGMELIFHIHAIQARLLARPTLRTIVNLPGYVDYIGGKVQKITLPSV